MTRSSNIDAEGAMILTQFTYRIVHNLRARSSGLAPPRPKSVRSSRDGPQKDAPQADYAKSFATTLQCESASLAAAMCASVLS
jgi:hypothetical protein